MKKLLILIAVLALASCSDDDSSKESGKKLYVSSVTIEDTGEATQEFLFTYDNQGRLRDVETDEGTTTMTYEGSLLKTLSRPTGSDILFSYDDAILTEIKIGDIQHPITYNEQERLYSLFAGMKWEINEYGDMSNLFINNEPGLIEYATDKKGPLYNVTTSHNFLSAFFLDLVPVLTSRPATFSYDTDIINTYDDDGYVLKSNYNLNGTVYRTIIYTYTKI